MRWRSASDADDVPRVIRTSVRGCGLDAASARVVRQGCLPSSLVGTAAAGLAAMMIGSVLVPIRVYLYDEQNETLAVVALFLIFGGLALAVTVVMVIAARALNGQQAEALLHAWLRVGRCPACTYTISSILPERDGPVRCPECAARWVMPRMAK